MATPAFVRLIREWNASVGAVSRVVGSRQRALAAVEGIKLQEYYGVCFASYRFLGKRGGLSNKAVQRMMDQLAETGLVRRRRIVRANKTQGTYVVDWSGLWAKVVAALNALARREWKRRSKEGQEALEDSRAHWGESPEEWDRRHGFGAQTPGPPG